MIDYFLSHSVFHIHGTGMNNAIETKTLNNCILLFINSNYMVINQKSAENVSNKIERK